MMNILAILLLIAVNVESQVEHCTCTMLHGLISVYVNFNRQVFPTIEWEPILSTKAKEELTDPGKHTRHSLAFVSGWSLVPSGDSIYNQVRKVLRTRFIRKLNKLSRHRPSKFGCNGVLQDFGKHQKNLTIGCLYRLTVYDTNSEQDN
ncbi:hypothetical protein Q1695_004489 [Nippostrongylus brasiliensis]|nr:hypothetical protein Q1695_004489 [Nippostrongylus brasiliensis]